MQLSLALKRDIAPGDLIRGPWYDLRRCYICGLCREVGFTLRILKYVAGPGRIIQEKTAYLPVCDPCGQEILDDQPKGTAGDQGN